MKKWLVIAVIGLLVILSACGNSGESAGGGGTKSEGSTLDRLKEEGKVKLGVANEKPYGYKTSDGEVTGVAPEITKAVFKEMGIDTVEGEVTEFGSLIPALQAGRFDVITAGMDIRPERCAEAAFGDVEIRYGEGMAVQKGNPKKLHSYEDIAKDNQIETADSISSNIAAVSSGRVDATVMTEATLREAVASADESKVEEVKPFTQPEIGGESVMSYGAAVFRKEDNELREAYNAELKKLIDSGKILEIFEEFGFGEDNLPDDVTTEDRCSK